MIISALALLTSGATGIYSIFQNKYLNQYEHLSKEKTKSDLLSLCAALRLIVIKSSLANYYKNIDINEEKKIVQSFLLGDTWLSMQKILAKEDNSLLILRLLFILDLKISPSAAQFATEAEKDIQIFCSKRLNEIENFKDDFNVSIANLLDIKQLDSLYESIYKSNEKSSLKEELMTKKLLFLRTKGIQDPNIDLFLSVQSGNDNVSEVKAAISRGANPTIPIDQIFDKYKDILKDFIAE